MILVLRCLTMSCVVTYFGTPYKYTKKIKKQLEKKIHHWEEHEECP
jgi:hypothetical protein